MFHKYLLNTDYIPHNHLGNRETSITKTKIPIFTKFLRNFFPPSKFCLKHNYSRMKVQLHISAKNLIISKYQSKAQLATKTTIRRCQSSLVRLGQWCTSKLAQKKSFNVQILRISMKYSQCGHFQAINSILQPACKIPEFLTISSTVQVGFSIPLGREEVGSRIKAKPTERRAGRKVETVSGKFCPIHKNTKTGFGLLQMFALHTQMSFYIC